jgi:hypothetical protein
VLVSAGFKFCYGNSRFERMPSPFYRHRTKSDSSIVSISFLHTRHWPVGGARDILGQMCQSAGGGCGTDEIVQMHLGAGRPPDIIVISDYSETHEIISGARSLRRSAADLASALCICAFWATTASYTL